MTMTFAAATLRPVLEGAEIVTAVQGGFVRTRATCDGVVLETDLESTLISVDDIRSALKCVAELRKGAR